jgi:predicted  nucleic acid-binding Zn-ribbon protein
MLDIMWTARQEFEEPMFSLKRLYDLQELDWQIAARDKSLVDVRARLADESVLASATARLKGLEAQLAQQSSARQEVEFAAQQLATRLQTVEQRLYGGSVTNPRELTAYGEEKEYLLRQRRVEEDKLLELMVETEELQSARDEARRQVSRLEGERKAEVAELLKAQDRLTAELTGLHETRKDMTAEVPPGVLSLYESLRKSRNGHAVAKVERGLCQGCRLALPTMELQRVRNSQDIVQCSSCRRILVIV